MAETVIIDIKVSNAEAVKEIEQSTAAINALKEQEKELREERMKGNVSREEYYKKLTEIREETERHKQSLTTYRKALKDNIKTEKENADSLNRMRQTLRQMLGEYDRLSKAEREGAKGQEMLKHIQDLTNELNEAEQASGRFQRQVGNYPAAFKGFEKYLPLLQGGVKGLTINLAAMGKQLLKIMLNPLVASAAAAVVVFQKLRDAFKRNDDAGVNLQKLLVAFKPVLDVFRKGLDAIVGVLGKMAAGIANAVTWVMKLIPGLREMAEAEQDIVASTDALEEREREYTVNSAKRSAEISEIRAKAAEKNRYTAEQRKQLLEQAMDLEQQDLKEAKVIAAEKLRLARQEAKVKSDTSDEMKNKIAELEAANYRAIENYNTGIRSLQKQYQTAVSEIDSEEKKLNEERKKRAAEAKKRRENELKERRATQDLIIAAMREGIDKERELLRVQQERAIEDLRNRLKNEADLTKAMRKELNEQLILLQAQHQLERAKLEKEYAQKQAKMQIEAFEAIAKKEAELTKMYFEAKTLATQNELDRQLAAVRDNAEETAFIIQQAAQRELKEAQMKNLAIRRENYQTEEEYKLALEKATADVIAAQKKATDAAKATAEAVRQTKEATAAAQRELTSTFGDIAENFGDLFETLASEDARYQDYATAMGYLQLLTSTAVSIATAVEGATKAAAATGAAAPFTLAAYIGEMVATVVGAIGKAKSLMAATANMPTYATGGVVNGAGTGTSDSITARVSNGESILTAKATAMFYDQLSAMNVAGGGRPFDKSKGNRFAQGGVVSTTTLLSGRQITAMADMIGEAVSKIQPVVSVREITNVANRVKVKEIIAQQ